jgi:hypothetical protein
MSFRPALEWRRGEVSQNRQVEGPFLAVFRDTALRVRSSQMGRERQYACQEDRVPQLRQSDPWALKIANDSERSIVLKNTFLPRF